MPSAIDRLCHVGTSLIGVFMKNKRQFWEQLCTTHYKQLYGFFLKRLGSPQDAADASQETFLRVVRRGGSAVDSVDLESPGGYLWQTAQNMLKEILRSHATQARGIDSQAVDPDTYLSSEPNPEEIMKLQQTRESILHVLNQLPPRCRQVFILHRFKGFSHQEIADQLAISPKTVENHMVNALLFFRKHLPRP